jgi:hypothetical protein
LPRNGKDNRIVFGSLNSGIADMSILDDAIREHLELKRAHGADSAELKKLEDEAFGPPARPDEPDSLAEAPTEFMASEAEAAGSKEDAAEAQPSGRRESNIADLQEAPEPKEDLQEEPVPQEESEAHAEGEQSATEHEAVPEPDAGHSTEERHAIAEQPTEHFDVEGEIEAAPDAKTSPSDEELVDAEISEPRLAPVDSIDEVEEEEEDNYFSEQRLSDELSQALDAPLPDEQEVTDAEEHEVAETDERGSEEDEDDFEDEEEPEGEAAPAHEDVLEDTPDFLEDAPEDDDLWFEQRPPKDFDFDD